MSKRIACACSFQFLALFFTSVALAQIPAATETPLGETAGKVRVALPESQTTPIPVTEPTAVIAVPISGDDRAVTSDWQVAAGQDTLNSQRIDVVTMDQPQRRQGCRVRSFKPEKLVCGGGLSGARTYLPEQVVALILPGEGPGTRLKILIGLNGAMGAAIWGTVVLAATCPACAAATAVAALLIFGACGAISYADYVPDRLIYLASGQHLSGKLRLIER